MMSFDSFPVFNKAVKPPSKPLAPALLLIAVSPPISFLAATACISVFGAPHNPNPPVIKVSPDLTTLTASSAEDTNLESHRTS